MFLFSYCQCLRLLHYTVFYMSLIVNMFPLAGVPVGPESFCLQCRYVSLKFSQGQNVFVLGGHEVNLGNKACKYVNKYFFVFLSIQFLSIVFPKHCKFTANPKLICFKLLYISSHILISWMRGVYSNSSMYPFPESGWGSCASPAPGSSPSA